MQVNSTRGVGAEATRARLRRKARRLFATKGYAAATTEDIVRSAGVTKGALYHHFGDKEGLFRAVVEDLEQEVADAVAAATAGEGDSWNCLERACQAYLDASLRTDIQRVLVLDAPSVLGWHDWCELDKRYGVAMFRDTLQKAIDDGLVENRDPEPLAQVLLGALNVAARVVATDGEPSPVRDEVWGTVARLLAGLRRRTPAEG